MGLIYHCFRSPDTPITKGDYSAQDRETKVAFFTDNENGPGEFTVYIGPQTK